MQNNSFHFERKKQKMKYLTLRDISEMIGAHFIFVEDIKKTKDVHVWKTAKDGTHYLKVFRLSDGGYNWYSHRADSELDQKVILLKT